jgi:hypothetical protein
VVLNIMQFSVDISVMDTGKYRKLVLTGGICRPSRGSPDSALHKRSEIREMREIARDSLPVSFAIW